MNILIFLNLLHNFAFNMSDGQGAFLLCHIKKPLSPIKRPEKLNNISLYLDNIIKNGKLDNTPAKTAPAPNATNRAGKAQQIRVPKLVNKLRDGSIKFFTDIGFILCTFIYFFYPITGIFK